MSDRAPDDPRSQDLCDQAAKGDPGALEALLDKYLPLVRGYVGKHAGPAISAKESGSDLAQSVCREILEQIRDGRVAYRGEAQFRRWLMSNTENKIKERVRYWRAHMRDVRRDDEGERSHLEELFFTLVTPSRDAAAGEELARFERAFARLSPEHREVIRLVRFEGCSHQDAGARLGIGEAQCRMRLSRALSRLARLAAADRG